MKISSALKYIYVTVPKAGSTSIFKILDKYYEVTQTIPHHDNVIPLIAKSYYSFAVVRNPYTRAVSIWYHMAQRTGDRYTLQEQTDLDDPCAFLKYLYSHPKIKEFQEKIPATRFQTEQLEGTRLDKIIKLENLEEEFKLLPFYNGNPVSWPKINVGKVLPNKIYGVDIAKLGDGTGKLSQNNKRVEAVLDKQYHRVGNLHWGQAKVTMESYLTPELKKVIYSIFKQDFDTFDYRK